MHMVQLMPPRPKTLSSLVSFKSRLVLPFWYRLAQVVLEKRPLNRCSVVVVVSSTGIPVKNPCTTHKYPDVRTDLPVDPCVERPSRIFFGTARMQSRIYASVGRPYVRFFVCPSVCPYVFPSKLLLWRGRQEITIDCCTAHSSAAGECGQCHVVSVRSS